jgi:hypothetical protein
MHMWAVSCVTDYSTWVGCSTGRGQGVLYLVEADFSVLEKNWIILCELQLLAISPVAKL